jgi:protein-tyrosine phosphatase
VSSTPFVIDWPAAGRIAMMRRPDGDDQLDRELAGLRALGVDTLVSALTDQDRARLGLMAEPDRAAAHGLSYRSFPIKDFRVPNRDALISLGQELSREVRDGRFVVVHCHGGVGRSGLIVGATLVALGATPDAAMTAMATARGHRAPETWRQRAMLRGLAAR